MSTDGKPRFRIPLPSGPTLGLIFVLAVFAALLAYQGQFFNFVAPGNLKLLLFQASVNTVVALGMLLIVISGGIDLSVGSVVALVSIMTMQIYEHVLGRSDSVAMASVAAVAGGLLTGAVCGLANGLAVSWLKVTPFVVTLGTMSLIRGLAHARSKEPRITFTGRTPEWVKALQSPDSDTLLVSPAVWSAVLLAIVVALLLHFTVLGRHCYAIGSNEATARLCGVPVERQKVVIYTLAGLLTAWGGILMFAKTGSGDTTLAETLALDVIAAVVIGGASLSGGRGTVIGTLVGVLLLSALDSLLNFTQTSLALKNILVGAVVIVNTALGQLRRRPTS